MQLIIFLNVFVIIISYFARFKQTKYAFEFSFLIIFLFTAFRYNFGTDYPAYKNIFNVIASTSDLSSINLDDFLTEKSWLIVCYIFRPIGFFGLIFLVSAFICFTYYSLIKKYVDAKYYWLAILVYVFSTDIMLIQFSAIRQGISIAIFLFSIRYLNEKRSPLKYVLLILLAGAIHTSAYIMLIFIVFAFYKDWKSNIIGIIVFFIFFVLLFAGPYILSVSPLLLIFIVSTRYLHIFDVAIDSTITLSGGAFWSLLFVIVLYLSRNQSKDYKFLYILYSIYFISYILTNLLWLGDRLGYYFAPFCIIVLPQMLTVVRTKLLKITLLSLFLGLIFLKFYKFFTYDWVIEGYSHYQTIFSQL